MNINNITSPNLENFSQIQQQNHFFLLSDGVDHSDLLTLFLPQTWQRTQRIIGQACGRGITWFIQTSDLWQVNVTLRHYYRGGFLGKLNKDLYWNKNLRNCRSFAEFQLLQKLCESGIAVPKPIAAHVEKLGFGFYRADLLSELISHAQDLTILLQKKPLSPHQWQKIGKLIKQLHNVQVCHTDLNAHNILLQHPHTPQEKCYLIDFDKCDERIGNGWKTENLSRLYRSFLKEVERMHIHFNQNDWQNLLAGYQQE